MRLLRPLDAILFVAVDLFPPLVAFLRFNGQGGNGTCVEALQAYRLARFFAVAVSAVFDAREGGIDFRDQLALAVTRPQLEVAVGV